MMKLYDLDSEIYNLIMKVEFGEGTEDEVIFLKILRKDLNSLLLD